MSARFLIIYIFDTLFFVLKFILIKRGSFSMICMEKRIENAGKLHQFKTMYIQNYCFFFFQIKDVHIFSYMVT